MLLGRSACMHHAVSLNPQYTKVLHTAPTCRDRAVVLRRAVLDSCRARVQLAPLRAYAVDDEIDVVEIPTLDNNSAILLGAQEFLKVELDRVFKTGILTKARYSDNVTFADPITKLDTLSAYQFSLQLIQLLFNVDSTVHSVDITGEDELTARFSMTLQTKGAFRPKVVITGKSVFKLDLDTGKIISHVDSWDALENNEYLSLEALSYLISQVGESTFLLTPELESPAYEVLKKTSKYEIRRYGTFLVAETPMGLGTAVAGGNGFNDLAGYIFGGNNSNVQMEMTTPVFTAVSPEQEEPVMQFVIEDKYSNPAATPAPKNPRITTKTEGGKYVAAFKFSGLALEWEVAQIEQQLRSALEADGLTALHGFQLARYNEPFVLPPFRRNEVLITLDNFAWP